jgi:hypothetical protein
MKEVQIIFNARRQLYAVPEARRDGCGLWLSIQKHPLPVPQAWRRDSVCVCLAGAHPSYYEIGIFGPRHNDVSEAASLDDGRVLDYQHAAWWTLGLEQAWVELRTIKRNLRRSDQPPFVPAGGETAQGTSC